MKIANISAFQIFDSRGNPTLEVEAELENGIRGRGLVPAGASTGQYEAHELRDGDPYFFRGRSVRTAIAHVNDEIATALRGLDVRDQQLVDDTLIALDGTPEKSRLGANSILGVSMAVADAAAKSQGIPLYEWLGEGRGELLPLPEIQILGGGAHANWRTDIQDFLVIATGAGSYDEALQITFNVYHAAADLLREQGKLYGVADEGGYWPEVATNEQALEFLMSAIQRAGYTPGREVSLSLDIAASDLFDVDEGLYRFRLEDRLFQPPEFADLIIGWCNRYPIISVEDPAADNDWDSWKKIFEAIGHHVQVVGDDLFTTNINRIKQGEKLQAANSVLIKLNQIGTVSETIKAIHYTQSLGWLPIVSARSGETEGAFISHLAVATNAGQLKVGSFARSERMVKWNEIIRIARHLEGRARFKGAEIFSSLSNQ